MITIDGVNAQGETVRILVCGSRLEAVYSDALVDVLPALGNVTITRASHVEPSGDGGWLADMRPARSLGIGPVMITRHVLGPFRTRRAALDAELRWLREHRGL